MIEIPIVCVDEEKAQQYAAHLREHEADVTRVDGRTVYIPTTYPPFAWDVAVEAVDNGYAEDGEVARVVATTLAKIGL